MKNRSFVSFPLHLFWWVLQRCKQVKKVKFIESKTCFMKIIDSEWKKNFKLNIMMQNFAKVFSYTLYLYTSSKCLWIYRWSEYKVQMLFELQKQCRRAKKMKVHKAKNCKKISPWSNFSKCFSFSVIKIIVFKATEVNLIIEKANHRRL